MELELSHKNDIPLRCCTLHTASLKGNDKKNPTKIALCGVFNLGNIFIFFKKLKNFLTASIAQAKVAVAALEAIARQPDIVGATQRLLILSLAFIESLVIYALLVFFMLQGKLAPVAEIVGKSVGH